MKITKDMADKILTNDQKRSLLEQTGLEPWEVNMILVVWAGNEITTESNHSLNQAINNEREELKSGDHDDTSYLIHLLKVQAFIRKAGK